MTDNKMVKDYNFSSIASKRIRTIGYKSDHNTPCKHFYNAWPMEELLNDGKYSGLYLALINASIQEGGSDYNGGYYIIFNEIGDNIHINLLSINGYDTIERLTQNIDENISFKGRNGFLDSLHKRIVNGYFVHEPELMALEMIGESELARQYREQKTIWLMRRERREKERIEKMLAEKAEQEKQRAEENATRLKKAEDSIRTRQRTLNTDGVILDLMRKYEIAVPLRTQGWILKSLTEVNFNGQNGINYRYWRHGKSRGSQAFFDYMQRLVNAIDKASANDPDKIK